MAPSQPLADCPAAIDGESFANTFDRLLECAALVVSPVGLAVAPEPSALIQVE